MVRLLIGGWSQATISAQAYLNMERAIIAQRRAGIGASATMVAAEAGLPGYYYNGNIPAKMGANGRYYANTGRGASGWTPVPSAMVTTTNAGRMTRTLILVQELQLLMLLLAVHWFLLVKDCLDSDLD